HDWWRTPPFAIVLLVTMAMGVTLPAVIVCFAISAILVWAMAGYFYEPDLRQRIAMATVLPIFGMVAFPLGLFLRRVIFKY
ncbi:MAG: hypothetical protein ABL994_21645, partial [Verrucomicrobiales bacterium]